QVDQLARMKQKAEVRRDIRAADPSTLGLPPSPYDRDTEALLHQEADKRDAAVIQAEEESVEKAKKAPAPKSPRWVNALRGTFQGIWGIGLDTARGAAYLTEEALPDAFGGGE